MVESASCPRCMRIPLVHCKTTKKKPLRHEYHKERHEDFFNIAPDQIGSVINKTFVSFFVLLVIRLRRMVSSSVLHDEGFDPEDLAGPIAGVVAGGGTVPAPAVGHSGVVRISFSDWESARLGYSDMT